ncbi:hypothetical protein U4E84_17310, partial [Halorubrum sp. AD140]|uniref:conjugal transfer protein TrbL family protein n=1 Tax=Halorubrum sp. AD140 TaxID=3050073 RepID=UPI002ACD12B3
MLLRSFFKKKVIVLAPILLISLFLLPTKAHADILDSILNPVETMNEMIVDFLNTLATSFASWAFDWLGEFIIKQTDLSKVPNLELLVSWSQYSAGALIVFFFVKRLIEGARDDATGEDEPNYAEIIGSTAVSMVLVWAIPEIIHMLISVNNLVVASITDLGIDTDIGSRGEGMVEDLIGPNPRMATINVILLALIWVICILIFAIVGAIRYVELALCLIIGPLAATAYTNRSQVFSSYITESIAVIFTQV